MQVKTILNRVQKYQSFVYTDVQLNDETQLSLEVTLEPRRNSRPICSRCGCIGSAEIGQIAFPIK